MVAACLTDDHSTIAGTRSTAGVGTRAGTAETKANSYVKLRQDLLFGQQEYKKETVFYWASV